MKNHSHMKTARRLREKIHPMMLVVTIRKDEDRGICNETLRELWIIVKDQIKEQTVAVVVMSKNSAIWRKTELKSAMQEDQLKYVDAEGMRVVTNSKRIAEQIIYDRVENVVTDGPTVVKDEVMSGRRSWKN